jgi:hypothetical protein
MKVWLESALRNGGRVSSVPYSTDTDGHLFIGIEAWKNFILSTPLQAAQAMIITSNITTHRNLDIMYVLIRTKSKDVPDLYGFGWNSWG